MHHVRGLGVTTLVLLLLATASALFAERSAKDSETARIAAFIANRYELYEDAREHAQQIEDSDFRTITTANIFEIEGRESEGAAATIAFEKAESLLEALTSASGMLAFCRFELDQMERGGAQISNQTRLGVVETKLENANAQMQEVISNTRDWMDDFTFYREYMSYFLLTGRRYYELAKLHPLGSTERATLVRRVTSVISDMAWEREQFWVEENYDAYMLEGDSHNLNGDPSAAVQSYLKLPAELEVYSPTIAIVRNQSLRGYVNAVETLITRTAGTKEELDRAKELIEEALGRFPMAREEERGLKLRMYAVSIDLERADNVDEPLNRLLELAQVKTSPRFRLSAAREIARIVGFDKLTAEQRMRCAKVVSQEDYFLMQTVSLRVLHATLASLDSKETFEAYAPFCYLRCGEIYEAVGRYLEASLMLKEAADRFEYWRSEYEEESETRLPKHFFDAKGAPHMDIVLGASTRVTLETSGDAWNFPKLLGERALNNAKFLVNTNWGDNENKGFQRHLEDMVKWFQKYQGNIAIYNQIRGEGIDAYNKSNHMRAAQLMLSTRGTDIGAASNDAYYAGAALINYLNSGRVSKRNPLIDWDKFFAEGYKYSDMPFASHVDRVDSELTGLPASVKRELVAVLSQLHGSNTVADDTEFVWLLAQYALRRSLLLQLQGSVNAMAARGVELDGMSFAEALKAQGEIMNAELAGDAKSQPGMIEMAKTLNVLISVLRMPRTGNDNDSDAMQRREEMKTELADQALELLLIFWPTYGPQYQADLKNGNDKQREEVLDFLEEGYAYLFKQFTEIGGEKAFAQAKTFLEDYQELYNTFIVLSVPENKRGKYEQMRTYMAAKLRSEIYKRNLPPLNGLQSAANRLDSYVFFISQPGAMEAIASGEGMPELPAENPARRNAMGKALKKYIYDRVYSKDAKVEGSDVDIGAAVRRQDARFFERAWEDLSQLYTNLYAQAAKNALAQAEKDERFSEIGALISELKSLVDSESPDAAIKKAEDSSRASGVPIIASTLASNLGIMRDYYAPYTGSAFREDLNRKLASDAKQFRAMGSELAIEYLDARDLEIEVAGGERFPEESARGLGAFYSLVARAQPTESTWLSAHDAWTVVHKNEVESWGEPEYIAVRAADFALANDEALSREIGARYNLGEAQYELYKLNPEKYQDKLVKALHNVRRHYNLVNWRGSLQRAKSDQWVPNFNKSKSAEELDNYQIVAAELYAKIAREIAKLDKMPEWETKYYAQHSGAVSKEDAVEQKIDDDGFYKLPKDPAGFLYEAGYMRYLLYQAFADEYSEFAMVYQNALEGFLDIMVQLADSLKKSGTKHDDQNADEYYHRVLKTVRPIIASAEPYMLNESGKAYLQMLRKYGDTAYQKMGDSYKRENKIQPITN